MRAFIFLLAGLCLAAQAAAQGANYTGPSDVVNGTTVFLCGNPGAYHTFDSCASGKFAGKSVFCNSDPSNPANLGNLIIGESTGIPCKGDGSCAAGLVCNSYYAAPLCSYAAPAECLAGQPPAALAPAPAPAPSASVAKTCPNPGAKGNTVSTCNQGTYKGETVYCDPSPSLSSSVGYLIIGKDTGITCVSDSSCAAGYVCDSYYGPPAQCAIIAPPECLAASG